MILNSNLFTDRMVEDGSKKKVSNVRYLLTNNLIITLKFYIRALEIQKYIVSSVTLHILETFWTCKFKNKLLAAHKKVFMFELQKISS